MTQVLTQDELRKDPLLISADDLRTDYLFGIKLQDPDGNELPNASVERHIRRAQAVIQTQLDLMLLPTRITSITEEADEVAAADLVEDAYDLDRLTWNGNWGFLTLRHRPVHELIRWKMTCVPSSRWTRYVSLMCP